MARPNERGLELTWHKPSRRWRKRIDGQDHWFGPGRGVSDRKSYRAALTKYRDFMDRRAAALEAADRRFEVVQALPMGQLTPEALGHLIALARLTGSHVSEGPSRYVQPDQVVTLPPDESRRLQQAHNDTMAMHPPQPQVREPSPEQADGKTAMDRLLDQFIREQERRHTLTLNASDSIHRNQRLGSSALRQIKHSIEFLRKALSQAGVTDLDQPGVEQALADYRGHLDDRVAKGTMTGQSADGRLKAVRPFFDWAWRNRHISEQPRNLNIVLAKHARNSTASPADLATLRKLWAAADDRMRTFIALALNCGSYAIDISTMQADHLTGDGYVARLRHKTTVPTKHKLWPITRDLIQRTRDDSLGDTGGLLFVRWKGARAVPLVDEKPHGKGKYDSLAREFGKLCDAVKVKVTWSQLRDTAAHWIERYAMNGSGASDPTLVSHFLGHSDSRMARLYLQQDPAKLDRPKLDEAIAWWGKQLNLTDRPRRGRGR